MGAPDTQQATQNLALIISDSQKDKKTIQKQQDEIERKTNKIAELESKLVRLKDFEGLIGNVPEGMTFEINNKILINAMVAPHIRRHGAKANPFDPKTPPSAKETAEKRLNQWHEAALEWVFLSAQNLDAMVKQKHLIITEGVDNGE